MMAQVVPGALFIDLFAGSGIVGFEALSRGASSVIWVEREPRNVALIEENMASLAPGRGVVVRADVSAWIEGGGTGRRADLVFSDPPYMDGRNTDFVACMEELAGRDAVREGGFFVAEMTREHPSLVAEGWQLWRDRVYGHSRVVIYRYGYHA